MESSKKYKALVTKTDSLASLANSQNEKMEALLGDINEICAGMQAIREAEGMLALQSSSDSKKDQTREKIDGLKNDIRSIEEAIAGYKERIAQLEATNGRQSAEFKKLAAGLRAQLEESQARVAELEARVAEQERELGVKTREIAELNENVAGLEAESSGQKERIAEQDRSLHEGHYLVGSRRELREAGVITRQGIFCPPIVSGQAAGAEFTTIDWRETTSIALGAKRAKVLSTHAEGSYELVTGEDGLLTLVISDPGSFWKQAKYLVVMANE